MYPKPTRSNILSCLASRQALSKEVLPLKGYPKTRNKVCKRVESSFPQYSYKFNLHHLGNCVLSRKVHKREESSFPQHLGNGATRRKVRKREESSFPRLSLKNTHNHRNTLRMKFIRTASRIPYLTLQISVVSVLLPIDFHTSFHDAGFWAWTAVSCPVLPTTLPRVNTKNSELYQLRSRLSIQPICSINLKLWQIMCLYLYWLKTASFFLNSSVYSKGNVLYWLRECNFTASEHQLNGRQPE